MTSSAYLSFVASPIFFLIVGWIAAFYHKQNTRRFDFESNTQIHKAQVSAKELVSSTTPDSGDYFQVGKDFFDEKNYEIDLSHRKSYNAIGNPYPVNTEKFFVQKTIWTEFGKRIFDVVFSIILLAVLAPAFFVIVIAVRSDGGPAFFAHRRVGRNGTIFSCLRFRTISVNHEDTLQEKIVENQDLLRELETYGELRHDPRITRVGRILRRTSFDELPQLINVLRGDMSFVGPRPVLRDMLEIHYGPLASSIYLSVRPGITSLDYSLDESNYSYVKRINSDAFYVTHMSFFHDMKTIFRTFASVIFNREAF